jgi:hypothetical protein
MVVRIFLLFLSIEFPANSNLCPIHYLQFSDAKPYLIMVV